VEAARAAQSLVREGRRSEDRTATRAEAAQVAAERKAIQTDLADSILRAPSSGQVLTRARETGAVVQPGEIVYTLALTQPVRVRAYVGEPDLPKVKPGMRVKVQVDGSGKSWPATIGFISPVAEFTPRTVQTEDQRADLVYRMRLTVDDPKGELRQGQPVTVLLAG
jgi:HlyD family secretion protein